MKELQNTVKHYWENKPLQFIVVIALTVRLIAVIFSKGYGMHDDHFLVIEVSQSWVEGGDVMHWFSKTQEDNDSGRSFIYPGMHYYLFKTLETVGIFDPQIKMYIVRFIHALFSLLTVIYGYKIVEKLSGTTTAKQVGLILALLWLMPSMSVRNLIEMVVIPMLMVASWWILIADENKYKWWLLFAAGIVIGIAFPIRYQTLFFSGGIFIVLVLRKKFLESIVYSMGMLVSITFISGFLEWVLWGYPFGKVIYYVKDNLANSQNYSTLAWYTYILQVLIIFTPPVSFFIFFGQFKVYKKYLLLFIPTFIFFAFHSYFPNKQERFIFTILPFILMTGLAGWNEILATSTYWQNKKKFIRGSWIFFWSLNTIVLCLFIFSYSKKARVEAAYYFHDKNDLKGIVVERTATYKDIMLPRFYMNHKWVDVINFSDDKTLEMIKKEIEIIPKEKSPNYVLFLDETRIEERVEKMKTLYPNLELVYTASPSLLDWILYKMNPININQVIYVYKII
jgi:4-amino-4-deoxy-L-arabinose transferase-like glycosyltransferase